MSLRLLPSATIHLKITQTTPLTTIPVRINPQDDDLWCWAAIAQLVACAHRDQKTQCMIATQHFSVNGPKLVCCPGQPGYTEGACNLLEELCQAVSAQGYYCTRSRLGQTGISWKYATNLIDQAIRAQQPVALRLTNPITAHYVAITGISSGPAVKLELQDPDAGTLCYIRATKILSDWPSYSKWTDVTHMYNTG